MLFAHPARRFVCPETTRFGSWQSRHIWLLELSTTRKFKLTGSPACTWGLWQLVHSMLPFTSRTRPVGSPVLPCDTKLAIRSGESFIGSTRLNGCDDCNAVPKMSALFIFPVIGIFLYAMVCPNATVPSWQLKHKLLSAPNIGCVPFST